jgi:thiamine biosynthesis lipoprotein
MLAPLCIALTALAASPEEGLRRYAYQERHMGVAFNLAFYAGDEQAANTAARAAFDRIAELDAALSDYREDSELSRLSATAGRGQAVPASDDLWRVLRTAHELSERSDGAFDVTVGPLVRLWRRARRLKQMPADDALAEARAAVGYRLLQFDEARQSVELTAPGMRLDLGGIAMGYAVDEALAVLRQHGNTRALLDASGDIGCGDPPPGEPGWRVGVAPLDAADGEPSQVLLLSNAAVTTSGDAFQFVEIDGVRYSHIVDPHTGLGLTDHSSVSVVAPSCIAADSLATAASVLGPERGLALIEESAGAAAFIVRRPEATRPAETHESQRWNEFLAP